MPRIFYSREQRAERMCLHIHSATAARVEYPAAELRYKFDSPSACCGVFDCFMASIRIVQMKKETKRTIWIEMNIELTENTSNPYKKIENKTDIKKITEKIIKSLEMC